MSKKDLRLNSSLTEYQELRTEIRQLVDHQLKLYTFLLTIIGAIIGVVFTTKTYDILLILPILALVFSFRYIFNSRLLVLLGDYLNKVEKDIFKVTFDSNDNRLESEGWQTYFTNNYNILPFHKFANFVIFIFIPFICTICYCIFAIDIKSSSIDEIDGIQLPVYIYAILLFSFTIIGTYIAIQLWRIEPSNLKNS